MPNEVLGTLVLLGFAVKAALSVRAVVASARHEWLRLHSLRRYWNRACQGRAWRRAFPDATADEIRAFLAVVTASFGFRRRRGLCFSPQDPILRLYRDCYPIRNHPDQLELETLIALVKREYGLDVLPRWREGITLGELFMATRAA